MSLEAVLDDIVESSDTDIDPKIAPNVKIALNVERGGESLTVDADVLSLHHFTASRQEHKRSINRRHVYSTD